MRYKYVPIEFEDLVIMLQMEMLKDIYFVKDSCIIPAAGWKFELKNLNKIEWYERVIDTPEKEES